MPASRWLHAMAFWDGRVYISGGRDGSDVATTTLWYSTLGVTLNYSSIGAYYSPLVDLGSAQVLESISWNASLPSGSSLSVSIATATQGSEPLASWTQVANGAPILTSARYLNYRVDMARGSDPAQTPVLQDITISYLPSLSLIPSNLRAAPLEGRKIKLDWDPSASTYTASYNIYYDSGTGAVNYADLLSSVSHPTTSYVTNPLTAGVTYRFGIRAQDLLGLEEKNTSVQASAAALETLSSGQVKAAIGVPQSGRRISGNLILVTAEIAQGNPSQVKEVAFQYRLASSTSSSWTNILAVNVNDPNPDLSPPYCIHWDATGLSSADYELRATAKDLSGSPDSYPSSIVITVDHASPEIEEKKVGSSLEKKELVFNAIGQTIEMADNCRTATTKIFLPSGLLNNSSATIKVVANPAGVPSPPEKTLEAGGQALDIGLANGQSQLNQPAAITLGYADSNNDGLVDGTLARADKLAIYSYNTTASRWQKEAQSAIDSAKKTVTAQTMHFSFFGLFAPAASDLSNALVYPVPYVPNDGNSDNGKPFNPADSNSGILFDNLTGAVKIQIYTVSGELVWEKVTDNSSGKVQWDAKNSSGQDVASGGYIALLTDTSSGHKVVKKLAVVR
ncbi:MAG: hypothetical protein HY401_08395 [Elusimicrobia bacterium]|nr:hypothetical protein [Elusimicrobiota bacterium]